MARTVSDYDLTPQRGENAQINWGEIATDFSSKIRAEIDKREARKKAIADDYAKQAEKLSVVAESDDVTIQAQLVEASQASMRELSDRYDLVKAGLLSPEDFSLFQTNQKADYRTASMLIQGMGKWAIDTKSSIESLTATKQDIFMYDYLTKYAALGGVKITTGKNGRIVYKTKKNIMTMERAKEILAEQQSTAANTVDASSISDEDAKAYVNANPVYGDEFETGRDDTMSVQEVYQLFLYRGDPGVVVDTTGAINDQVKVLGSYVRSYFNDVTGVTTTTNDFRNAPGTDDTTKGGAYRESLQILQDRLATSEGQIVQVLTNLGGYQLALNAEDARRKYGDDVDLGKIIYMNYKNGEVTYTNMEGKKAEADKVLDREFNTQLDSSVTKSAPNTAYQAYIKGEGKKKEKLTSYVSAVETMLTTDNEEEFNTQARLLTQRINAGGTLGDNKLNRIIREGDSYIIEFMDADGEFYRETPITFNKGDSTKAMHEALFSLITPDADLNFEAYSGAITDFGELANINVDYERARTRPTVFSFNDAIMPGEGGSGLVSTIDFLKQKYTRNVRSPDMEGLPGTISSIFQSLLMDTRLENQIVVEFADPSDPDGVKVIIGGKDYSSDFNWVNKKGMEEGGGGISVKKLNAAIHKIYKQAVSGGDVSVDDVKGELDI